MEAVFTALLLTGYVITVVYLTSGVDDALLDLAYWLRAAWRRWSGRRYAQLSLEWLEAREQAAIAILIPVWHEAGVIGRTLRHLCETVRYRNFDVFVGTYPNDPDTQKEVDEVCQRYERVHKVVLPSPGPTTKAQNLNELLRAVDRHESRTGRRYEIFVTHDAEDVVHPFSLLLFNYLVPRFEMIQLPVFPAPVTLWNFTHWTYADEFAERHTRELVVRERRGFVPSAGVGTAYSRRAVDLLRTLSEGQFFPAKSFTEDYAVGLRLRMEGLRSAFVRQRLPLGNRNASARQWRWVATQALFPRTFGRAVAQKARWIFGIGLQSWHAFGWPGSGGVRWNLIRDRKILLTAPLGVVGYLWVAAALWYEWARTESQGAGPPLVAPDSVLWPLIVGATTVMVWRLVHRLLAVAQVYGTWAGITSVPRSIWANVINGCAVVSAVALFWQYWRTGRARWVKTQNKFPEEWAAKGREAVGPVSTGAPESEAVLLEDERLADELRRALVAEGAEVRRRALRQIPGRLGRAMLEEVTARLRDPEWTVRAEACRVLGFFRLPEASAALRAAMSDPSWVVRANAAKALSKLGEEGEAALLEVLRGEDRYAREIALATLEQGHFLAGHLQRLGSADAEQRELATRFFQTLEQFGPSRVAREMLARTGAMVAGAAERKQAGNGEGA